MSSTIGTGKKDGQLDVAERIRIVFLRLESVRRPQLAHDTFPGFTVQHHRLRQLDDLWEQPEIPLVRHLPLTLDNPDAELQPLWLQRFRELRLDNAERRGAERRVLELQRARNGGPSAAEFPFEPARLQRWMREVRDTHVHGQFVTGCIHAVFELMVHQQDCVTVGLQPGFCIYELLLVEHVERAHWRTVDVHTAVVAEAGQKLEVPPAPIHLRFHFRKMNPLAVVGNRRQQVLQSRLCRGLLSQVDPDRTKACILVLLLDPDIGKGRPPAILVLVGMPGEPFAEIGLATKARSTASHTMFAGYCNGILAYWPTAETVAQGGMSVRSAVKSYKIPAPPTAVDRGHHRRRLRRAAERPEAVARKQTGRSSSTPSRPGQHLFTSR